MPRGRPKKATEATESKVAESTRQKLDKNSNVIETIPRGVPCPYCESLEKDGKCDRTSTGRLSCLECGKTWSEWQIGRPHSLRLEQSLNLTDYKQKLANHIASLDVETLEEVANG